MYKIMIVEDEFIIALAIKSSIEKMGYEVEKSVRTGEEAIQYAAEFKPSLVLMDITLAGTIDGIEAAEQIQKVLRIPVLFITGNSDQMTLSRAMKLHPAGILIKPVLDTELERSLEEVFGK